MSGTLKSDHFEAFVATFNCHCDRISINLKNKIMLHICKIWIYFSMNSEYCVDNHKRGKGGQDVQNKKASKFSLNKSAPQASQVFHNLH